MPPQENPSKLILLLEGDPSVVRLRPGIPRVRGVAAVFERDQVVLLVARHAVGLRNAPGGLLTWPPLPRATESRKETVGLPSRNTAVMGGFGWRPISEYDIMRAVVF